LWYYECPGRCRRTRNTPHAPPFGWINSFIIFSTLDLQFILFYREYPYFNGADGMLLVFDVTLSSTFSNIKNWYKTAVKYGLSRIPRILIGNKVDLKEERKIIRPMATHLAEELNATFFETSAKSGQNVDKIFRKISELLYHSKKKPLK